MYIYKWMYSISIKKFQVGLFDKRDLFPFSIARVPEGSSNIPCSIAFFAIDTEPFMIARASKNPLRSLHIN